VEEEKPFLAILCSDVHVKWKTQKSFSAVLTLTVLYFDQFLLYYINIQLID